MQPSKLLKRLHPDSVRQMDYHMLTAFAAILNQIELVDTRTMIDQVKVYLESNIEQLNEIEFELLLFINKITMYGKEEG